MVPRQGRTSLLDKLHLGHPGICRMKALARSTMCWPNIDKESEIRVKSCNECLWNRHKPAETPLHPWEFPGRPWSRLHIDYAGPVQGKLILAIVDSYSKWIEAHVVTKATGTATINKLRLTFATHGLPDIIVSDNGANFTSEEFAAFMKSNGIKNVRTAPYHPASNGQPERVVHTVKERLRKQRGETLESTLSKVLFHHRLTPNTTTGRSPAELLMNRKLKSRLDLIRPDVRRKVEQKQEEQKLHHDRQVKRNFGPVESVAVENQANSQATNGYQRWSLVKRDRFRMLFPGWTKIETTCGPDLAAERYPVR